MTRVPWEVLEIRTISALVVGMPLLLAGVDLPSSMQRVTVVMLVVAVVLAIGATVAVSQPSLIRVVAVFGSLQAFHFGLLLYEGFRDPKYLLVTRPQAEMLAVPGLVFIAMALSDLAELGLVVLAWRNRRDGSHEASDRFLAIAGVWLAVTALFRWPPFLAALDLDDHLRGLPVRLLPLRSVVQLGLGVVAVVVAVHRLRVRRLWLTAVANGSSADFTIVDVAGEDQGPRSLPVLSKKGSPRLLVRAGSRQGDGDRGLSAIARLGSVGP
jgi:hypothetical protein